ncbi:UDP-2,4-diacetamido-2,4,6-trideoxy-beta-L-altropyranose hydrolase [bacterium]|nr:MAG: UDP-2,4-diacetamido-2,4,6-trideoxy-beta-L-altropyranose hydrolase [bacterium]
MRAFVRADSSRYLGTGHVMRCLTVAQALRRRGIEATFIARRLPGDITALIEERGWLVRRLPGIGPAASASGQLARLRAALTEDAVLTLAAIGEEQGWLIVDHYALDARWEAALRPRVRGIVAIDDLADRPHVCEGLLDQGLHADAAARYRGLVAPHTRLWLGPAYALLREEFMLAARAAVPRDGAIRRLLITLGGSDPRNLTAAALAAVAALAAPDLAIDVVVPPSNPHRESVARRAAEMPNVTLHGYVEHMADLMGAADLAIGAGGTTAWERCALGLPSIMLVLAENQAEVARNVAAAGAAWNLGEPDESVRERLYGALVQALREPGQVCRMSRAALALMRGAGARWLDAICTLMEGELVDGTR